MSENKKFILILLGLLIIGAEIGLRHAFPEHRFEMRGRAPLYYLVDTQIGTVWDLRSKECILLCD
ncbi:hypothetical protein [Caudoviricetes sp.]|nr:hypothetical protein [Caudoviricetes sp.]